MTTKITKRPTIPQDKESQAEANVERFIRGAPDRADAGLTRGNRVQISHTIKLDILKQVDQQAGAIGLSRAALINLAIADYLKRS